jgi:hypothetical protein
MLFSSRLIWLQSRSPLAIIAHSYHTHILSSICAWKLATKGGGGVGAKKNNSKKCEQSPIYSTLPLTLRPNISKPQHP